MSSQESDDELDDCPICVEPFDESDRLFLPCHCNYRVCMFCVRRLMTEFDGRCPGCRSVYNEANFRQRELDPDEIERRKQKEKQRAQAAKQKAILAAQQQQQAAASSSAQQAGQQSGSSIGANKPGTVVRGNPAGPSAVQAGGPPNKKSAATGAVAPTSAAVPANQQQLLSPLGGPSSSADELAQQRKGLASVRVVQHHVVFVLGLPLSLAKEEILRRPEHFGQYGPIIKIVVGHPASAPGRQASASAHITFQRTEDAREAIRGVDGIVLEGHQIRASFGTTRYCNAFLKGQNCTNPDCLFLHQEVDSQTLNKVSSSPQVHASSQQQQQQQPSQQQQGPEPLNGMDLAQFEKRGPPRAPATKGRAPGAGVPPFVYSNSPPSYDCALSFCADVVVNRNALGEDMKRKFQWIIGSRARTVQFSGLECILSAPSPLFIASVSAAVQLKDAPEAEHLVQGVTSQERDDVSALGAEAGSSSGNNNGGNGNNSVAGQHNNKKANRKNKKQFSNNRIGGGDDAY